MFDTWCSFGTHEKREFQHLAETMVRLVHCSRSRDPQVLFFFFRKTTSKLSLMTLFTHLKIILLQYFQFLTISGIQTDL